MIKLVTMSVSALLLLSACEDMSNVTTATRQEVHEFMYGKEEKVEPVIMESRYCYKARADVLCYDSPQLGKEDLFIGAQ